jgi:hypothetical protein
MNGIPEVCETCSALHEISEDLYECCFLGEAISGDISMTYCAAWDLSEDYEREESNEDE